MEVDPRNNHEDCTTQGHVVAQHETSMYTGRRRQKRSCDQCRRGKRACDAGHRSGFPRQACANCRRKKQPCTFHWLDTSTAQLQNDTSPRQKLASSDDRSSSGRNSITLCCDQAVNEGAYHQQNCRRRDSEAATISLGVDGTTQASRDLDGFNVAHGAAPYPKSDTGIRAAHAERTGKRRTSTSTLSHRTQFIRRYSRGEWTTDSSLLADESLGGRSSRATMTNGLLRIYHDSMENALSCWLTEHNCPYTMSIRSQTAPAAASRNLAHEWGSSWSNRMFDRVIHLDRAYARLRKRPLRADEERTVSKALNMSIMAFASQWTQAGDRAAGRTSYQKESGFVVEDFPQSNDFERSMQESLWHQTSQLLHQAASIDSFRVVFAMIIFSLAQKPLDTTQATFYPGSGSLKYEDFQAMVQDEEAPLFLEIALRQILSHRRKLERLERDSSTYQNGVPKDPLDKEDRATFNLLYWLGVMFDTLSAAMFQRAVVVNDDDCELPKLDDNLHLQHDIHDLAVSPRSRVLDEQSPNIDIGSAQDTNPRTSQEPELWGELFILSGRSQPDHEVARWPCSYELAASTLSHAAPVKVLLFRRVSHLQALVSRRAPASRIESAIASAFDVYDHWNRIYDPFMTDCIKYHDELPTRVQSWYTLLAGHWHLGTFLLSDLLLEIDDTHLSLPTARLSRKASNIVTVIRRHNALAVADLSRSSVGGTADEAQDFHFALNQAALLTEPWTVVFVRSLCRAGYILAEIALTNPNEQESGHARRRCGDCIEGLWSLGRKSDMAFLAARFLSDVLSQEKAVSTVSVVSDVVTSRIEEVEHDQSMGQVESGGHDDTTIRAGIVGDLDGSDLSMSTLDSYQSWLPLNDVGSNMFGPFLPESETFGVEANLGYEMSPFVDIALQQQLWGY